jgi:hypothetical protein
MLELQIKAFITTHQQQYQLFREKQLSNEDLELSIRDGMTRLIEQYVASLATSSDLTFNDDLAKSIVAMDDITDMFGSVNEYTIRKHLRELLRAYITSTNQSRHITISDKAKFGFQMEHLGINIGYTTDSQARSSTPDGNVVVVSALAALVIVAVIFGVARK